MLYYIFYYIFYYILYYTLYIHFFALYIISQRLQRYLYCYMLYELYDFYAVIPAYNGWISLLDAACPVHWWSCQKNREKKVHRSQHFLNFMIDWAVTVQNRKQTTKPKNQTKHTKNTQHQKPARPVNQLISSQASEAY